MLRRASLRKNSLINQETCKQLVLPVIDGVSLLVEQIHDKFSQILFDANLVRISLISVYTVLMRDDFLLWWLVETRLLLELGWYLVKVGVLRTWSPPINFSCPPAVFGIVPKLGDIISFGLSFTLWSSDVSILSTCSRSATIRVPFQTSPPAYQTYSESVPKWWNFNKSRTELEWYSFQRTKENSLTQLICRCAFPQVFRR